MIESRPITFRARGSGLVYLVCGTVSRSGLGIEGFASIPTWVGSVVHGGPS